MSVQLRNARRRRSPCCGSANGRSTGWSSSQVSGSPLTDAVNRLAGNQQIPQQDQRGLGWRELRAAVLLRQSIAKILFQAYPTEQSIQHGQSAHRGRIEHAWADTRHRQRERRCRRWLAARGSRTFSPKFCLMSSLTETRRPPCCCGNPIATRARSRNARSPILRACLLIIRSSPSASVLGITDWKDCDCEQPLGYHSAQTNAPSSRSCTRRLLRWQAHEFVRRSSVSTT